MLQQANKNGISLIILVITIIIVIILAGAVIVALNNSGVITKAKLAKESSEFTSIREAVELEKQNMLLTGTFDRNKIDIPNIYEDDIEVTAAGEILIKYNENTKIIDIANAIKILGASYISNGFDEIQSISGGTAPAGETKLAKIIIEGKSQQTVTTQGKNLIDPSKITVASGYYYDGDGVNGGGASGADSRFIRVSTIDVLPNTTYSLSSNLTVYTGWFFNEGTSIQRFSIGNYNHGTFTTPSNCNKIRMSLNNTSGIADTSAFQWIQLEKGSPATSYEAFVPNSPSPAYPSTINSVSNFNLVSSGKNILNKDNYTIESFHRYKLSDILEVGQTYTISANTNTFFKIAHTSGEAGSNSIINVNNVKYKTFTWRKRSDGLEEYLYIGNNSVTKLSEQELAGLNIQLEEGNTATSYEQFKGRTVSNFPCTLRSLPDGTKDYVEIDNVNKTEKLYENIGNRIFTGDENWILNVSEDKIFADVGVYHLVDNTVIPGIGFSNYFNSTNINDNSVHIRFGTGYIFIYIEKSRVANLTAFKSWLSDQNALGTPVTVQYKLATPTVTDLTYQELQIGYPLTNIYTTSAVKPRIIGQVTNK